VPVGVWKQATVGAGGRNGRVVELRVIVRGKQVGGIVRRGNGFGGLYMNEALIQVRSGACQ
jgi:hypothetical protein